MATLLPETQQNWAWILALALMRKAPSAIRSYPGFLRDLSDCYTPCSWCDLCWLILALQCSEFPLSLISFHLSDCGLVKCELFGDCFPARWARVTLFQRSSEIFLVHAMIHFHKHELWRSDFDWSVFFKKKNLWFLFQQETLILEVHIILNYYLIILSNKQTIKNTKNICQALLQS